MSPEHEQLPCGSELEALVAQVAEGIAPAEPAHQADCPYCQATLRALRLGWDDVQTLSRQPVAIPAGLTARIMARVRKLARLATDSILLGYPRGETRVSHALVARVIGRLAAGVPGVVFASARAMPDEAGDPGRVKAALRIVVAFGPPIEAVTRAVRAILDRRIPFLTGARLSRIDIRVEGIADVPTDALSRERQQ